MQQHRRPILKGVLLVDRKTCTASISVGNIARTWDH